MNEPRFEVFPERRRHTGQPGDFPEPLTGAFAWHFRDANARITFTGGESFTRREDAHRSIRGVGKDVIEAAFASYPGVTFDFSRFVLRPPIVDLDENGDVVEPEARSHEFPPAGSDPDTPKPPPPGPPDAPQPPHHRPVA